METKVEKREPTTLRSGSCKKRVYPQGEANGCSERTSRKRSRNTLRGKEKAQGDPKGKPTAGL